MAKLKIGDTLVAPKDIIAYMMDDITVTLSFQKGQKIGVIRNIDNGSISFFSSFDNGFGDMIDAEFYVYSSDFDVKEDADTDETNDTEPASSTGKGGNKTTVDDILDIFRKSTETTKTKDKESAKKDTEPEPESNTILGLSPTIFYIIVGAIVLIMVVIFWGKSDTSKVIYQQTQPQSQPQTLSGVERKSKTIIIPKMDLIIE